VSGQPPRVYLAGPDVFERDPARAGRALKELCAKCGLAGEFPLDAKVEHEPGASREQRGLAISRANEDLIRSCSGVLANLTPFRGPSADVGTVYEVGFAIGLGKPVVGYTNAREDFFWRTIAWLKRAGIAVQQRMDGSHEDASGMQIEAFDLCDNLMIPGGIARAGGEVITRERAEREGKSPAALAAEVLARILRSVRPA
jgi:nucleoside 2-deoxyribosyltransferase